MNDSAIEELLFEPCRLCRCALRPARRRFCTSLGEYRTQIDRFQKSTFKLHAPASRVFEDVKCLANPSDRAESVIPLTCARNHGALGRAWAYKASRRTDIFRPRPQVRDHATDSLVERLLELCSARQTRRPAGVFGY
jgi:hypothetical protein